MKRNRSWPYRVDLIQPSPPLRDLNAAMDEAASVHTFPTHDEERGCLTIGGAVWLASELSRAVANLEAATRKRLGRLPHPHDDIMEAVQSNAHALHDYAASECRPDQDVNVTVHSLVACTVEAAATLVEDPALARPRCEDQRRAVAELVADGREWLTAHVASVRLQVDDEPPRVTMSTPDFGSALRGFSGGPTAANVAAQIKATLEEELRRVLPVACVAEVDDPIIERDASNAPGVVRVSVKMRTT